MKITESIILALIKQGMFGEAKNFKTSVLIPGKTKEDGQTTVIITAESLQIRMIKEGK